MKNECFKNISICHLVVGGLFCMIANILEAKKILTSVVSLNNRSSKSFSLTHCRHLVLAFIFLLTLACNKPKNKPSEINHNLDENTVSANIDTSLNIGKLFLNIEFNALNQPVNYAKLDTILAHCTKNIQDKSSKSLIDMHQFLFEKQGIKCQTYSPLLSESLKYGLLDCDNLSLLYLSIAEKYKLPLKAIVLPQHLFVVWETETDTLYYETTEGAFKNESYFKKRFFVQLDGFKVLKNNELLAVAYLNVAQYFQLKGKLNEAQLNIYKGMEHFPNWENLYATLGQILVEKNEFNLAEIAFKYALELNPNYNLVKEELKKMYVFLGCYEELQTL